MTGKKEPNEMDRLDDAMLEELLNLSDNDIAGELQELGYAPDAGETIFKSALSGARMEAGLEELKSAKIEVLADKRKQAERRHTCTPDQARAFLVRLEKQLPEFTKAARNADGSPLSDSDALAQLEDILELLRDAEIEIEDDDPS